MTVGDRVSESRYRLGIDIGGTFTDAVLADERGALWTFKVLSTPPDLGGGFMDAADRAMAAAEIDHALAGLFHATTVATNAIIEGKTARVALVVTTGFRDILEIARQIRPDLYDLMRDKPTPLIPRELVLEVDERIGPRGEVMLPLNEASVEDAASRLAASGVEAVVICLLHSYVNPAHEQAAGRIFTERLAGVDISLSSEIWPEFREYFRASTAILNAAVRPVVRRYIDTIQAGLAQRGLPGDFWIMQSGGGVMTAEVAKRLPIQIIESGPAAGLIAAAFLGNALGWRNVVSLDIGGTTAKVGLIRNGQPTMTYEYEVGAIAAAGGGRSRASGYPIRTPVLDLVEIGAGGGALAWLDSGGALRVGPQSAGASPGPASYGRGGTQPTLTDANVVLGRIDPHRFLGGAMPLDPDAAHRAIETVAGPLGRGVTDAAQGIVEIADATMIRALRLVTVQRGYDPRNFVLVAFGGAGPLHANALAASLGFPTVVIPPNPGVLSAVGLLQAKIQYVESVTAVVPLSAIGRPQIVARFRPLERSARRALTGQGVAAKKIALLRFVDLRFKGQSYELSIPVSDAKHHDVTAHLRGRFLEEHERSYGHASLSEQIEVVNWKVFAVAESEASSLIERAPERDGGRIEPVSNRSVRLGGHLVTIPTFERDDLRSGDVVHGPAVIAEMDATTFVHEGFRAVLDGWANIVIEADRVEGTS